MVNKAELFKTQMIMEIERSMGKKIVLFHICSLGQVQFIEPIYREIERRQLPLSCFLACDYDLRGKEIGIDIPASCIMTTEMAQEMELVDLMLMTEIYGRGPKNAIRIFIGHGQPNKWTNWSDENLQAFELYFLYGELERSMFEVIKQSRPESTQHIKMFNIGYPKLDDQINGVYNRKEILESLGLDPNLKTIIYAPAWDPGGAVRTYGTLVPKAILQAGEYNVITKLHPASLEPPYSPNFEFYTGGNDFRAMFSALESNPRFKYVEDFLINPLLFVSDLMVTDFSGVALEFMIMDRPVIYLHCPDFYEKTLIQWGNDPGVSLHDERFNAGRNAGLVVKRPEELIGEINRSLINPEEFSGKRKTLSKKFIYNPGQGSKATVDKLLEIIDLKDALLYKMKNYYK